MDNHRNLLSEWRLRAEELKASLSSRRSFEKTKNYFHDIDAWSEHQELQGILEKLLLADLDYALDNKVDVDLWNYCFKDYISTLQLEVNKDSGALGRTSPRHKAKLTYHAVPPGITLTWFLDMASGFYANLLHEIGLKYDLDYLPFMRNNFAIFEIKTKTKSSSNNCNYISQHCLVHLGDLARYGHEMERAEQFYRAAIRISPYSGQAYNQVALLEAHRGNNLSSVYFYVRSMSLKHPFPAAATNLSKMFSRIPQIRTGGDIGTSSSFISKFLYYHALLHGGSGLKKAAKLCDELNEALTSLMATESLSANQLLQMVVISLFQLHNFHAPKGKSKFLEERSKDEVIIEKLLVESVAGMLNAFLLPVYTTKRGKSLLNYFALPTIKLILDWIAGNPGVLEGLGFLKRLQIWPILCGMLNELWIMLRQHYDLDEKLLFVDLKNYPLKEDCEVRAFLPLEMNSSYNYKWPRDESPVSEEVLSYLRVQRLVEIGRLFCADNFKGRKLMILKTVDGDDKREEFEAAEQTVSASDLQHVMSALEVDSSSESIDNTCSDSDDGSVAEEEESVRRLKFVVKKESGILRSSEQKCSPIAANIKLKTSGRNVAMSAIMRQAAKVAAQGKPVGDIADRIEDRKQVKFMTPSPVLPTTNNSSQEEVNSQQSGDTTLSQDSMPSSVPANCVGGQLSHCVQKTAETQARYIERPGIHGKPDGHNISLHPPGLFPPPLGIATRAHSRQPQGGLGMIGPSDADGLSSRNQQVPPSVWHPEHYQYHSPRVDVIYNHPEQQIRPPVLPQFGGPGGFTDPLHSSTFARRQQNELQQPSSFSGNYNKVNDVWKDQGVLQPRLPPLGCTAPFTPDHRTWPHLPLGAGTSSPWRNIEDAHVPSGSLHSLFKAGPSPLEQLLRNQRQETTFHSLHQTTPGQQPP